MINKDKITCKISSLIQEMRYRYNAEKTGWNEETYKILNTNWDDDKSVKNLLDKYIGWWFFEDEKYDKYGYREMQRQATIRLVGEIGKTLNQAAYSDKGRNEDREALAQALADDNFDFTDVIDEADMAYGGQMTDEDLRKVFGKIYKYICEE